MQRIGTFIALAFGMAGVISSLLPECPVECRLAMEVAAAGWLTEWSYRRAAPRGTS